MIKNESRIYTEKENGQAHQRKASMQRDAEKKLSTS